MSSIGRKVGALLIRLDSHIIGFGVSNYGALALQNIKFDNNNDPEQKIKAWSTQLIRGKPQKGVNELTFKYDILLFMRCPVSSNRNRYFQELTQVIEPKKLGK